MTLRSILSPAPKFIYTIVAALIIAYFTLIPHPIPVDDMRLFPEADKVVHFIFFFGLTMAAGFDLMRLPSSQRRLSQPMACLVIILVLTVIMGCLVEMAQDMMNLGRTAELTDFLSDSTGSIVGFIILVTFWKPVHRWWWPQ